MVIIKGLYHATVVLHSSFDMEVGTIRNKVCSFPVHQVYFSSNSFLPLSFVVFIKGTYLSTIFHVAEIAQLGEH